jgi:hypothetical protein
MNTETDYLKKIAAEIAANKDQQKYITEPDHHLDNEAKRLEKEIRDCLITYENFTQRDTFHFDMLSKLVDICDILFDINGKTDPNVMVLITLLSAIKQIIPAEIRPNLRLPKAFVQLQKQPALDYWMETLNLLKAQEIDSALIDIAAIPFQEFTEPKHKVYWGNYTWLKCYERKLEMMDWDHADCNSKTEALISLLIGSGLNHDRFFIYCKDIVKARTAAKTGRKDKLKELASCRKLILQDARTKSASYNYKADPLVTQLLVWITAEEEYVNIHEPEQPFAKLRFAWFAQKISFFFKLLHEQNVFEDTNFQALTQQIASTCTSVGGEEILPTTLISKAYPKKQKMLEEMEALLSAMLEYVRSFLPKK